MRKSSPYYNLYKPNGKGKSKLYSKNIVLRVILQYCSLRKGFDWSILSIDVIETSSKYFGVPPQKNAQKAVAA